MNNLHAALSALLSSFPTRISLTLLLILTTPLITSVLRKYQLTLQARPNPPPLEQQRRFFVFIKNTSWLLCAILIFTLWASQLATTILSIAALTGALLIVSKELILNIYGYWLILLSRLYQVGDTISLPSTDKLKVVNINWMVTSTTDLFGNTTHIPNSTFITQSATNHSTNQSLSYSIHHFSLDFPSTAPIHLITPIILDVATKHTHSWIEPANTQLESIETNRQIDLPSARPRVLWMTNNDGKSLRMTLRFTCPPNTALDYEQAIILDIWPLLPSQQTTPNITPTHDLKENPL